MKQNKLCHFLLVVLFLMPFFLIISCPGQSGDLPFYMGNYRTAKFQIHPDAQPFPTRVAVYIDAERYSPLNALYYVLQDGTQFFDYVILGSLQLRRNAEGLYIYTPPGLAGLLARHSTHINPLRSAGIKVLLGVRGGHAGVTFSSIDDFYKQGILQSLNTIMRANRLDGFEIWDIDGADIARPWLPGGTGFPYPSGFHRLADGTYYEVDLGEDAEFADHFWFEGGQRLGDFILMLRAEILGGTGDDQIIGGDIDEFIIIVREENFGAWIPEDPPIGTFTTIFDHLNFSVNPNPAYFGSSDGWGVANFPYAGQTYRGGRRPGINVLPHEEANLRHGPLAIELNPKNSRLGSPGNRPATVVPPLVDLTGNNNDIFSFTKEFYRGDFFNDPSFLNHPTYDDSEPTGFGIFGIVQYRGLRPVSVANSDDVFNITQEEYEALIARMTQKRDELGFNFNIVLQRTPCGTRLTQAGYMSITSLFLFGQRVINMGGNHIKNW